MPRLDHMAFSVRNWQRSRDWYRDVLGFAVEFENPERKTVAMKDDADLTIFLNQTDEVVVVPGLSFTIQVADVDATHRELSGRGIAFVHPPMKVFWATAPNCSIRMAIAFRCGTKSRCARRAVASAA